MKPVQETLTRKSTSDGPSEAAARVRRARPMPISRAHSRYRPFCVSKSRGWKTSAMGTTLARVFTPAES